MSAFVLAVALAAAALAATWPSLQSLFDHWVAVRDYQYGLPIALIALVWIVAAARQSRVPPQPSWSGILALAASLLAWLVAHNAHSQVVHQMLMPVVVWTAVLAGAGRTMARRLMLPTAYLFFAIPIWDYAVPVLQWLSVIATETTLALAGVPAEVSEFRVTLPVGSFEIVEGCSGKRYFMVTLAVGVLAVAVNRMPLRRATAYLAACGVLALLANWLRIFVVIVAGHVSNMRHYLVAVEHETFGNVIFALLVIAVLLMARRFGSAAPRAAAAGGADAAGQPLRSASRLAPAGLALAILIAAAALPHARARLATDARSLPPLPVTTAHWQGPLPGEARWDPRFQGVSAERRARYSTGQHAVEVYVNLYLHQAQGAELVLFENRLDAPGPWRQSWPPVRVALTTPSGQRLMSFEAGDPAGVTWLFVYRYQIGAWGTTSDGLAQIAYGLQSMLRPAPSGMVALAMRCDTNCESARALVMTFWDEMAAPILVMIGSRN
ncbi:MAG: exosortase C-terminal domain/associated protein EpsI [Gammaproteobacteria bacterium]